MNNPLLILHLEDNPRDAELVRDKLQQSSMACKLRVASDRAEYEAALAQTRFDLILSDYTLPDYDGMAALALARVKQTDVPFILISGTLGEEAAVDCVLRGATDYILKQRLDRLVPAVLRALTDAEERRKRRESEELLCASEMRYRRLFEAAKDGILILNAETGTIMDVNPFLVELLGYSREAFLEKKVWELGFFKDIVANQDNFAELQQKEYIHYEDMALETGDGRRIKVEFVGNVYLVNHHKVIQCNICDITERKQVEEALRISEEKYRSILANIEDGYYEVDLAGNFTFFNDSLCRTLGYSKSELIGKNNRQYTDPANAKELYQLFNQVYQTGEPTQEYDWKITRKDGTKRDVEASVSLMRDAQGQPVGFRGIVRDITRHKQEEEILRQSEEKYRHLFEEDLAAHYISTADGRVLECNPAFVRMFGFASIPEAKGQNAFSLYPVPEARAKFLDQLKLQGRLEHHERELRRRDGSAVHVIGTSVATFNKQGDIVTIHSYLLDETKRVKAEEQLRQAQKMEAVGRLAGGIAHDFNNLLGIIVGYSELLMSRVDAADPMHKHLQEIEKAGNRGAALTRQMLAFSRKQVLLPAILNLNTVVEDTGRMLHQLIGDDIKLVSILDPELAMVKADPVQIEQIILNLAINSRDAMPMGGKLTIETANIELDENYSHEDTGFVSGSYVMLAVSDTGIGMDKETQAHIFEPFFTTKEQGKGTGLGLSTVYGIVKQSNGHISLYSEVGQGATFKVYLPRVEGSVAPEEQGKSVTEIPRGTETVLLVEDADGIRKLIREILQSCGYTVLETDNPLEAIQIEKQHGGKIPLLVTDVVMPGMSGRILADALKSATPGMKVLYISGYTDNAIVHHGVLEPGIAFLQKPFTRDALARKVREILDSTEKL